MISLLHAEKKARTYGERWQRDGAITDVCLCLFHCVTTGKVLTGILFVFPGCLRTARFWSWWWDGPTGSSPGATKTHAHTHTHAGIPSNQRCPRWTTYGPFKPNRHIRDNGAALESPKSSIKAILALNKYTATYRQAAVLIAVVGTPLRRCCYNRYDGHAAAPFWSQTKGKVKARLCRDWGS